MVAIQGLGGVPEPKPSGPSKARNDRESTVREGGATGSAAASGDGVSISAEARAAAEASRLAAMAKSQDDIRADRVEQARQNLERGTYKDPEVVAKVAEKLLKYLT